MLCAFMVWWLVHSSKLVCYWMCPKVAEKQCTNESKKGSISSTCGSFHLDRAYGFHIEIQDHNKKDDCYERHDDRRPRLYFTLQQKIHFKQGCSPLHVVICTLTSIKYSSLSLQMFSAIHHNINTFILSILSYKPRIPDIERHI